MHAVRDPSSGPQRLRVASPEDRDERRAARDERPDRLIGDRLPALSAMRRRRAGRHRQHPVQQQHAVFAPRATDRRWSAPARRGRLRARGRCSAGCAESAARRARPRTTARPDAQASDRVLADDEHPHVRERLAERPQDVRPGRQVATPGRHLGPQEVTHRRDLGGDGRERLRPTRLDDLAQRARPRLTHRATAATTASTASATATSTRSSVSRSRTSTTPSARPRPTIDDRRHAQQFGVGELHARRDPAAVVVEHRARRRPRARSAKSSAAANTASSLPVATTCTSAGATDRGQHRPFSS